MTGTHTYTVLHVSHHRARRGSITRGESRLSMTMYEDVTCCVREPVGECRPCAMIAYSETEPRWHKETRQAKVNLRPRASQRSCTPTLWTRLVVVHLPSGPRVTVSIAAESSMQTLWIELE